MRWSDRIRRWFCAGICCLVCLALHGFAIAQAPADTSGPQRKAALATPAAKKPAAKHTTSHPTSHTTTAKSKNARGKKTTKKTKAVATKRGQQAIDSTRATEIQTALIREHYMQGEPSGTWDNTTQAAMQHYQADQGWQSKQIPDSRALIKLGLGPSHDHLLNPESAMTTAPSDPKTSPKQPTPDSNLPKQ
jgi:hypothetical protein